MQIVIPMSGFGERFRRAGYTVPKPLIEVDGKPIIHHVIDLFPGAERFVFICNQDHLDEPAFAMRDQILAACPEANVVGIAPHKLGPVHAVLAAEAHVDPALPTVINYCDFTCYWRFDDFRAFVEETDCDGAIPCYKGFHPHMLGSTSYAYVRHTDLWVEAIQEKQPFTETPMEEYASSGTYYVRSGAMALEYARRTVAEERRLGGEFYVSLMYQPMLEDDRRVAVYEIQHFMQWGTPSDLEVYVGWSDAFRAQLRAPSRGPRQAGAVVVPMAGAGRRFAEEGYTLPKPLIPVSGKPMAAQAVADLPEAPPRFVLRSDLPEVERLRASLEDTFPGGAVIMLDGLTEGQAITCALGCEGLDEEVPVTFGACDNGLLYDPGALERLLGEPHVDVIVWTVRGHPDGRQRPEMFGWVSVSPNTGLVDGVSVKIPLQDPSTDPMITGTFTFRRVGDFRRCLERLRARDGRVKGEFYLDSCVEDAVALGLRCVVFDVDHYLGWGTPNDLRSFEYWQSCFDKWPSHPYRLDADPDVPKAAVLELREAYAWSPPARPGARR